MLINKAKHSTLSFCEMKRDEKKTKMNRGKTKKNKKRNGKERRGEEMNKTRRVSAGG